jgi:eukaryotic-like serine/threonine-protein kinase
MPELGERVRWNRAGRFAIDEELRQVVQGKLELECSPEQNAAWLRLIYLDHLGPRWDSVVGDGGSGRGVRTPGGVIDGRYLVRELLGRGGMAEVFRATDTETDRGVAIKFLRSVEPGSAGRFRSEVDILARLDHPGLVKLRGSGTHEGVPYLVLDLAEGPSLAGELAGGPIGVDRALAVGEQVAETLAHAHRVGIVHRDVKPSNILFDDLGRARLADFGIARLAGTPSLTGTGQLIGSAPYLAPEQVAGERAGPAADVYSLGLVVIECLTGRPCYPGGQIEAAITRLHRPPVTPSRLPAWLREVLSAMTARDPVRRPSMDAVAEALGRRNAEPVLAPTKQHDLDAMTALSDVLPATARHDTDPATALPDVVADPALTTHATPADSTAVVPHGSAARSGGLRPTPARRVMTLLAAAVVSVLVVSLLAWMVAGGDPPVSRTPADPDTTPTTTVAPTTVLPPLPGVANGGEAPPAPGQENGRGDGNGRGNGNARGNGKGND